VAIEVEAGDLIRVPRGTLHWFDLCGDRRIRAIVCFRTSPDGRRTNQQRRGPEVRAGLLGSPIHSAANGGEVAGVVLIDELQIQVILLDIEGTTTR